MKHRALFEHRADLNLANVMLDGDEIEKKRSIRYLGSIISDDLSNFDHISRSKRAGQSALTRIKRLGFVSCVINANLKANMYKTYIRPTVLYGCENMILNGGEMKDYAKIESNIVKRMLGIQKRCRTKSLFRAINVESTRDQVIKLKFSFYQRLR